ncbi:MAG: hypothetical protein ACHQ0J_15405 [Candidatus Dormibacterales bacterium]
MTEDADGPSRRLSGRLHVRLSLATRAELVRRSGASGVPASSAARQLIEAGLRATATTDSAATDHAVVALSALIAAEHAVLMVASVLPDGELRMVELAAKAAQAAEERLALFLEAR